MSRSIRWAAVARTCLLVALLAGVPGVDGLAPGGSAHAQALQIEAVRFAFDRATNVYVYEEARLTLGEMKLYAGELTLDVNTGQLSGRGFLRVESPAFSGVAEGVELDASTRVGRFLQASLHDPERGLYVRAEVVTIHPDGRLVLESCTFTACAPSVPVPWSIAASELELQPDGLAVAWNPRLFVGAVPVLWLPGLVWPVVPERRTGMLVPSLDRDSSSLERFDLGWRLRVPVFLNLGFDHDLTVTPEQIENRGTALALEYNYAFWERQRGSLTLWGVREVDARERADENDILTALGQEPADEPLRRFRTDWVHNQALGEPGRVVLSYRDTSDGQVRREYDGTTEFRPYRTYQASATGQWQWIDTALTVEQNADYVEESVYADSEAFTDLKLRPQLRPRFSARLGGQLSEALPLALELGLSATRFVAEQDVSGQLYTASPSLTLPIALGGAFELRPTITRHVAAYEGLSEVTPGDPDAKREDARFSLTEGALELRTALARVYEPEESRSAAIKHIVTPRLIYTGVQDVAQPLTDPDRLLRARIAQRLIAFRLDNQLLSRARAVTVEDTLGSGNGVPPDALAGTFTGTTFAGGGRGGTAGRAGEARAGAAPTAPAVRELLRFDLIQRYDLLQRADAPPLQGPPPDDRKETLHGEPWLPLLLDARLSGSGYTVGTRMNYHHQLERNTQFQLYANGRLDPRTQLGFAYTYNEFAFVTPDNKHVPESNSFSVESEFSWSSMLSTGIDGRVNLKDEAPPLDRRIDRGSAFVDYHPTCYAVRLSYSEQVATAVESGEERFYVDRRLSLTFSLGNLAGGKRKESTLEPDESSSAIAPRDRTIADASALANCG